MANGKIEKREEQHLHPRKKAICNKSAKLVLIIAAALWTLQQGRRLQLAADVHVAHSIKESVESLQLEALAAEKSRGGGTTKQTLRLMALAAGKSRGGGQRNRHYVCWRSRQESLEEKEQRNRHYVCWRSRKEAGRGTKSVHIWRSRRHEEVAAGGTKLEDEQSSFTTRIATAQEDEYDCATLCAQEQTLFFCVRKRPCFVCPRTNPVSLCPQETLFCVSVRGLFGVFLFKRYFGLFFTFCSE